ncbi:sensor histidine kinase [Pseudonocardia sp. GCM10023141]|uniref:sensor histidine kinase n=1 Tax=Pseudonocardia sp. GCM10023141 TaxID=3252653 RepID=UPI0036240F66
MASRSLRTRLVATVLLLLAVATIVIGGATTVIMRQFLISSIDTGDLKYAVARVFNPGPQRPGPPTRLDPANVNLDAVQLKDGLAARIRDGQVVQVNATGRDFLPVDIPQVEFPALAAVPPGPRATSVNLGPAGQYRMQAFASAVNHDVIVIGVPETSVRTWLSQLITVEIIVAAVALLGAGLAGTVMVRRALQPLERVAATAARVSRLPLDRGEVLLVERVPGADPNTEVGQVGAALNHMLDHVGNALEARQESEMQLRQFVADASHELRTPLAAIRGYAELTRRTELPEETTYSLQRISSQAERMTTLVEDMLLLARLDAGRPLERREVDLTRLVLDGVSDAHAAGPDHHWRLDLPDEPVTVPGDASRLAQVLANLLANARTHTPPGSAVTASLARDPDSVRLTVTDDGPGIAPELLPHIFERFARGSTSRSRTNGSTGLGLAIVHAVVHAHGGAVGVASSPGRTTFTVHLPTAPLPVLPVGETNGAPPLAPRRAHAHQGSDR